MNYVFEDETYIALSEFAELVKKKPETILRRKKDIPCIKKFGNDWYALNGTRYPYKVNSFKIRSDWDRRYVLLKALDRPAYIDGKMLGVSPNEFDAYIQDFSNTGLIYENHNGNPHGANPYSCTLKGAEIIKKSKIVAIKMIMEECAKCIGIIVGKVVSRTFPAL